jgi:hypothetical protein
MPPTGILGAICNHMAEPDNGGIEYLRFIYGVWRKREAGQTLDLDGGEGFFAEQFEEKWRKALAAGDRGFVSRLDRVLNPSYSEKLSLREAVFLALRKFHRSKSPPTWAQIKTEVEKTYGIKRDADTWKKLRASAPFRKLSLKKI